MTQPQSDPPPTSLAEVAAESPEQSVAREKELVGDAEDTGDLVPEDRAQ